MRFLRTKRVDRVAGDAAELESEHIEGFRKSQALAYACATEIAGELREGITEIEAARRMATYLSDHGVQEYFHRPFVWFGDRTAFTDFYLDLQFFPTRRRLEPGMPVILDVAPVVEGHISDIGYACRLGDNPLHAQMVADLEPYRALVLEGVRAHKKQIDIYRDVDALIENQGYDNRHLRYPYRVLGHRVTYLPVAARSKRTLGGFGIPALKYVYGRMQDAKRSVEHRSPLWNDSKASDYPTLPGLWAVEPHLGFRGTGVKWEEILVVTETDAYWLDDDLPHVRAWRENARAGKQPSQSAEVQA
jgi:Xaa-Pro aminopeptidase